MDLLTGYDERPPTTTTWGMCGTLAVAATDRARCAARPARRVFFDGRARSGGTSGSTGGGTYQAGLFGEEVVADGLAADGWRILGHRVRTKVGELDLVARRGDTVAFVEVKTSGPNRYGADEAVDGRQRHRIRRAAIAWMTCNPRLQRGVRRYRFDVYFVCRDADGAIIRIDHVPDAF